MANSDYFGLANSLSRARRPPAQNDVYMHNTPGAGRPPQQFGGGPAMAKPGWGGAPYGGSQQQGFGGGGFGSGLAGINAVPGGFQNPVSMAPPMGGMSYGGDARPPAFGGGPTPMPGGGGPAFGGGPTPAFDPTQRQMHAKPMGFGGGPQMLGPPKPMQVPGFGGGPAQTPLEDYTRPPMGRRFP